jgi:hypothetical protein
MEPAVAVIVAAPTPPPVATPLVAIAATIVADELQLTPFVTSCLLPSLYVPVATNCWLVPFAIEALPGLTESDRSIGGVAVKLVEFAILPEVALILASPIAVATTRPLPSMGATAGESEDQLTEAVRSVVLPSV